MLFFKLVIRASILAALTSVAAATKLNDKNQTTANSERGIYRVILAPQSSPAPIGRLHNWVINLNTAQGEEFFPHQLVIQGGMPGHGHGFPVEPQITRYLENGSFLIEGVLFNMAGEWQLRVGIDGPIGWDTATVKFSVRLPASEPGAVLGWKPDELDVLKSLGWSSAATIEDDPSNRFTGNRDAIALGKALFFDPRLSASGKVSCATCHQPAKAFTDGEQRSLGTARTLRHTPSLLGVARHRWFYWDGRRDSLWAQAVTPIETRGEMDNNRLDVVRYVLENPRYRERYKQLVGELPAIEDGKRFPGGASPYAQGLGKSAWLKMHVADRRAINSVFANLGKFIAAYESTLDYRPTRFDRFVDAMFESGEQAAESLISDSERRGIKLFLDQERTQCLRCHNGPLFSNKGFHNIGTGTFTGNQIDFGRVFGLQSAQQDVFNCRGRYSDATETSCFALRFALKREVPAFMQGAFKVPSLRNVANTPPYSHDGRFSDLFAVIDHYRQPPKYNGELQSLDIDDNDIRDLIAFLHMLSQPVQ